MQDDDGINRRGRKLSRVVGKPTGEWRLKLYRGWWYATRREYNDGEHKAVTIRRSLRTTDRATASQRLEDLRIADRKSPADVRGIVAAYRETVEKPVSAERNGYSWTALETTFAHLRPDQITRAICVAYANKRRLAGVGNGTIRKELAFLRAAVNWSDPNNTGVFELPPPADPKDRFLTRDEFKLLMDSAEAFHVKIFIALALATAARKQALLTLTWDRVDLNRGLINLGRSTRQKGRAVVPVNAFLLPWLKQAKEAAVTDYVVEWGGGAVGSIRKGYERAVERAGLSDVTPHTLRHTAAVWMAEAGVPMSEIAQYLGHRDTRTTERIYARYSPDYLRGAASALNPLQA